MTMKRAGAPQARRAMGDNNDGMELFKRDRRVLLAVNSLQSGYKKGAKRPPGKYMGYCANRIDY